MKIADEDEPDEREGNGATSQHLEAQEVSVEEYKNLAKRIDTMEASVGFVLTKVEREILSYEFLLIEFI